MRSEAEITGRLRKLSILPRSSSVVLGIGDDCAVFRPRGSGEDLIFTTDLFVEGTHFLRETHGAADVARVALARSLSDVAAMGGAPRFCLVSLCAAPWADQRWIDRFFDSLVDQAAKSGAFLAGGDLSHGAILVCDVTVCGSVPRGAALRRDGARPGDRIYVSGALGGSARGLETGKGRAWKRHLNPEPRLELARYLREKLGATAGMDLSDGLSLDLRRMCLASGIAAEIGDPPRFPGASLAQALHGGEDYELLFSVRPETKVPATGAGVPLTCIGVASRPGGIAKSRAGDIFHNGKRLEALGYDHFAARKG